MRRVVVTGLGLVTPLACGVEESWVALLAGKSGASTITRFKTDDLATKIACQVPRGDGSDGTFNPEQWVDPKELRRVDDFIIYGLTAAKQAVRDSGWEAKSDEDKYRTGVLIGSVTTPIPVAKCVACDWRTMRKVRGRSGIASVASSVSASSP